MPAEPIRWGILSTGEIAGEFARGLESIASGRTAAVASRAPERAAAFAERYGGRACASYEELVTAADVDAVYVATPHPEHARWAIRALEAGKHVLCEKPLTVNHPEAMAVVQAARDNGVFLMEAFMYRFHPQTAKLAELVRDGAVGRVGLIRATFAFERTAFDPAHRLFAPELAGGAILDIGGYTVSAARLLAGAANGTGPLSPIDVQGAARIGESGVDEVSVGSLRFAGGVVAELVCGVRLRVTDRIEVFGDGGRIVVDAPAWLPDFRSGGATSIRVERDGHAPERIDIPDPGPSFALEADTLARFRDRGESPELPLDDTLDNMLTLDRWRHAVGLRYPSELPRLTRITVAGRELARRADAHMPTAAFPGIARPLSRMVMGVDSQPSDAHAAVMFDAFYERGGTTFDTAWMYGPELCRGEDCEVRLGRWMASRGVRDELVVINKGAHSPYCFPGVIRPQLLVSLGRLQTDRVDLYFVHRDNPQIPVGEFVDALNAVRDEGLVGEFGASNWSRERYDEAQAYAAAHGVRGFSALSNQFSLAAEMVEPVWDGVVSASDDAWRAWLTENRVPLFAWSTLARGFLAGRGAPAHADPEVRRAWYSERNLERLDRLEQLARERGVAPATLAMAYVLHQPFPTFALIGPRTLAEARPTLAALDVVLADDEVAFLVGAGQAVAGG
jgi:predicted dehydrogenase/aryl-alcohol dehydrogenase-like predicted oxidoreductase